MKKSLALYSRPEQLDSRGRRIGLRAIGKGRPKLLGRETAASHKIRNREKIRKGLHEAVQHARNPRLTEEFEAARVALIATDEWKLAFALARACSTPLSALGPSEGEAAKPVEAQPINLELIIQRLEQTNGLNWSIAKRLGILGDRLFGVNSVQGSAGESADAVVPPPLVRMLAIINGIGQANSAALDQIERLETL